MAAVVLISFWLVASAFILLSALVYKFGPRISQAFDDLLLYGKVRGKRTNWSVIQAIEVPKKWFLHFYITGVVVNAVALYYVTCAYVSGTPLPAFMQVVLNRLTTSHEVSTDAVAAVILIALMWIQNARRLLECLFVSVYSRGTMNLAHYMLGIVLYSTFWVAVMSEAPQPGTPIGINGLVQQFHLRHLVGLVLFAWASWHHNRVHVAFAGLRKNEKGDVTSYQHHIPRGGWFEYISCPHYFMEMLLYVAFGVVGGTSHLTVWSVVVFVLANQLVAGYLTHDWYRRQFKENYPKNRRAVLPYVL